MKVKLMNLEKQIQKLADKAINEAVQSKDALSYSQAALNLSHANATFSQIELNKKFAENELKK
jgi:hypothetical protein